jgi:hypothetical protein
MSDWVQIHGSDITAEPECFKRNSPTASEAIQHFGRAIRIGLSKKIAKRSNPGRICGCLER